MNCIYIGGVSVYSVTLCLYVGGGGCTNDVHILVQVNKVSVLFCSVNSALCIGSISFFYLSTEVNVVFVHVFSQRSIIHHYQTHCYEFYYNYIKRNHS